MDTYCKCIVRLNDFFVVILSSFLSFCLFRAVCSLRVSLPAVPGHQLECLCFFGIFSKLVFSIFSKSVVRRTNAGGGREKTIAIVQVQINTTDRTIMQRKSQSMQHFGTTNVDFSTEIDTLWSSKKKGRNDKRTQRDHRLNRTEHKMHWSMPNLIEFSVEMGLKHSESPMLDASHPTHDCIG